jgi:hypothetical protein
MSLRRLFARVRGVGLLLLLLGLSNCIGMMSRKGWNDPGCPVVIGSSRLERSAP